MTETRRPSSPAMQDENNSAYAGKDELWANEKFLQRYNTDIVAMMATASGGAKKVLEFGAGIGTLARLWQARTGVTPDCLEIDGELRAILHGRDLVVHENLSMTDTPYDAIYSSNVLEHIDDDGRVLTQLHAQLKSGGTLAIFVPAFMCLYSELDAAVGHYRRYEKAELLDKLALANFAVRSCHFVDSIGFFAWLSIRWRGYSAERKLGSNNSLAIYDQYIYPVSKFFDAIGCKHWFGKNILVIATKMDAPHPWHDVKL